MTTSRRIADLCGRFHPRGPGHTIRGHPNKKRYRPITTLTGTAPRHHIPPANRPNPHVNCRKKRRHHRQLRPTPLTPSNPRHSRAPMVTIHHGKLCSVTNPNSHPRRTTVGKSGNSSHDRRSHRCTGSRSGRHRRRCCRRSFGCRRRCCCRRRRRRSSRGRSSAIIQISVKVAYPPLTRPRPIIGQPLIRALPISHPRTPISRTGSRSGRHRRRSSRGRSSAIIQISVKVAYPPLTRPRPIIGQPLIRALPISHPRTPISRTGSRSGRHRRRSSRGRSSAIVQISVKVAYPPLTRPRPIIGQPLIRALPISHPRTPIVI